MSEIYTGRKRTRKEKKGGKHFKKAGKMLVKQTVAAIVCTLTVWGMSAVPVVRLNEYAMALGKAIRYETDTEMFEEFYENIKNIFAKEKKNAPVSDDGMTEEQ